MKIGILIPVHNERRTIQKVIREAKKKTTHVIVVLDGSTNGSEEIIKKEYVRILVSNKNLGLVNSLKKGFKLALRHNFDLIVKIDGDGQMDITCFDNLVKEYSTTRSDVISAIYKVKSIPWVVKKDIIIYTWLFNLATNNKFKDIISEYRLFSKRAMRKFLNLNIKNYASNLSIIPFFRSGCKIKENGEGVDYSEAHKRPFPIAGLINLRKYFIIETWKLSGVKPKFVVIMALPLLFFTFVFNITFGIKYNSILSKRSVRA